MASGTVSRAPLLPGREFDFTADDFSRIRALIYRRAGISLSERKGEMVYSRLRSVNSPSFRAYLDALESGGLPDEWEAFTNALTTNLTAFFREAHHFPVLAEQAREARRAGRPFSVWCAAASTGEEPYSIAMTLAEVFGATTTGATVVASDVDTGALATARHGVYPLERVALLSAERLKHYFLRGTGRQAGMARVRPELQAMVEFRQINLLDRDWPLSGRFDAIFCRNVMIYFDKPTQAKVLDHFVPYLKADGLLYAGHSESFLQISQALKLRGKTVYALSDQARAAAQRGERR
jgi:chemotaxis protein methyltransferase CheR